MALRIRGRSIDQPGTVDQWDRLLTAMLREAVTYGELDEKYRARKAWLSTNQEHPQWIERNRQTNATWHQRNEAVRRMMDTAEAIGRYQASLPAVSRDGLSALLGHELTPYAAHRLALTAARLQSTDVFAIVATWLMDEDAEEACNSRS